MWFNRYSRCVAGLALLVLVLMPVLVHAQTSMISVGGTNDGIPTLVGPDGRTLYTFAHDHEGESTCYDACAEEWPPLIVDAVTEPGAGEGMPGQLGTVEREDGSLQATYDGWPLYYYHEDAGPGDSNGQGLQDVWFAANPALVMANATGASLTGPGGMTLYIFTEDHDGESYCYEECAVAWPPLVVSEGMQPSAGANVPGELGLTQRDDGEMQVTYNGMPLYFFKGDEKPGDTNGDGVKDVWFVAAPETTGATTGDTDTSGAEETEVPEATPATTPESPG